MYFKRRIWQNMFANSTKMLKKRINIIQTQSRGYFSRSYAKNLSRSMEISFNKSAEIIIGDPKLLQGVIKIQKF